MSDPRAVPLPPPSCERRYGCWTDYPILALGDVPYEIAPVRRCWPILSDGDKYAKVLVQEDGRNVVADIKWGYLYATPSRYDEEPVRFDVTHLEAHLNDYLEIEEDAPCDD